MADKPKGSQRVQIKVVDVDSGQEVSSHEMVVAAGASANGFCCCTTSSTIPHHPGPPVEM
jgi:hypothetical protein